MAVSSNILPPRYHSPERIGAGGMGEIYRATDTTLGRTVAVKVLAEAFAQDAPSRARFTREALAAARLSGDPHTVTIFDVGEWNGRPFIVMEELTGGSLEQRLRRGRPSPAQALDWLEQAASALDAAHAHGVVHRDVKPGNLLLDGEDALYVADFGVASAAGTTSVTMAGTVLGTAGYLAPEQARGEVATPASDRYALAVVAYELLTGSLPGTSAPRLPGALETVFARALADDPARRPGTAAELVAELRRAFTVSETPTLVAVVPARRRSRLPLVLGLLAAAAAGALVAAILASRGDGTPAAVPSVSVRTVTTKSRTVERTVERTVTRERPPTTAPVKQPAPDGHALNDQGYARLQSGDAAGALPLLTAAVQKLAGTGPDDPYEGYANYNAGIALLQLGRCTEAKPYLEQAKRLEHGRHEPEEALKQVRKCERPRRKAARRTAARRTPGTART